MKKRCVPLLLLIFLLCQCSSNKSVDDDVFESGMTQIDTAGIVPTLMKVVKEYISAYPEYKNLALHDGVILARQLSVKREYMYLLGPTSLIKYGEYYWAKPLFPSSYMVVDGRMVFVNSSNDKLARQDLCRNVYMAHLEINGNAKNSLAKFWLVMVDDDGRASIYSKNAAKLAGIRKTESSIYDEVMSALNGADCK